MSKTADEYTELLDEFAIYASLAANGCGVFSIHIDQVNGPGHYSLDIPTHRVDAIVKAVIDGITSEIGEKGLAGPVAENVLNLIKDPSTMN